MQIYDECMEKDEKETISLIFYDPLASFISGGTDRMAQLGASHCILQFFCHLYSIEDIPLLSHFFPKFLQLFLVLKIS
jgi:hypothetical protein